MFKSFKYRIYPTQSQQQLIKEHIGSTRLVYNLALECKQNAWLSNKINLSAYDLINQLPDLKEGFPWLKKVYSQSLCQAIINMEKAYKNFFTQKTGFPKKKRKDDPRQSYQIPDGVHRIKIENNKLYIPKFREGIKIIQHRPPQGIIKHATIRLTPSGKYYVSLTCQINEPVKPKPPITEKTTIGIDFGIKSINDYLGTFFTTSEGVVYKIPKFLSNKLSKLKYIQSRYSRFKGKRTKRKLNKLHEKITNQRYDFLQKISTTLIRESQSIAVEDLSIKNMIKNHNLARTILDRGWGSFINMLKYKAEWYGKNLLYTDKFFPSTKTCSNCGFINDNLSLKDRKWICPQCNTLHDRDVNAAINIKMSSIKKNMVSGEETKIQNELPAMAGVMTSETILNKRPLQDVLIII